VNAHSGNRPKRINCIWSRTKKQENFSFARALMTTTNRLSSSFGWTRKDTSLTNLTSDKGVINALTSVVIQNAQVNSQSRTLVTLPWSDDTPTITYTLSPGGFGTTIFQLDNPINVSGAEITIQIGSTSGSVIGDVMLLMLTVGPIGDGEGHIVTVNYDTDSFFYTTCNYSQNIDQFYQNYRVVRSFTFDGVMWVNSDDNC
jgi:hypothetical protein